MERRSFFKTLFGLVGLAAIQPKALAVPAEATALEPLAPEPPLPYNAGVFDSSGTGIVIFYNYGTYCTDYGTTLFS